MWKVAIAMVQIEAARSNHSRTWFSLSFFDRFFFKRKRNTGSLNCTFMTRGTLIKEESLHQIDKLDPETIFFNLDSFLFFAIPSRSP